MVESVTPHLQKDRKQNIDLRLVQIFILLLGALYTLPSTVYAQEYTINAVGVYMIGDGPDENVNTAKERARTEALRQASEQAGVYVESYSKTQNLELLDDEVEVVSAQICKIKQSKIEPQIVDGHIEWKCSITAVVNTDNIDLKTILADKQAVKRAEELQQSVKELQAENRQLKTQYGQSIDDHTRKELNKRIQDNGKIFNETIQKLPIYAEGKWQPGIDANSVQYDKENQTITFQSKTNSPKNNGGYTISCCKIYINRNSIEGLWAAYYAHDGSTPQYFKGGKQLESPITPGSYQEILQTRLYNYFGIAKATTNNVPDWKYVYTTVLSNGVRYPYYIDLNNYRYDEQKNICIAFVKMVNTQYRSNVFEQYYCDFNNHTVGVSETAYGNVDHWENIDSQSTDPQWVLKKAIYDATKIMLGR